MKVNATEQAIEFDIAASVNGPLAHIDAVIKHFPNPFSEGARIEVTSNYVGEILFEAYALTGKKICAQKGHHNGSGATSFMLDAAHVGQELDKGAYIYVVTMDGKRYTNSIVKQ